MNEERISEYIDREGIASDTAFFKKHLDDIYAHYQKLGNLRIQISGADSFTKLTPILKEANEVTKAYTETTKAITTAITSQNKTLQENVEAKRRLQAQLKSLQQDQKEDLKLRKVGVITAQEYTKRTNEISSRIEILKNRQTDLNKAIRQQINEAKPAENAYKLLVRQYEQAAMKAKILAVTYGESNIKTVEAARRAKELNEQLKRIDASTGQNHRNVANYTSGWAKFGAEINKSLAPLRTFVNIMPGLGMSGIVLLLANSIGRLGTGLAGLITGFKKTDDSARIYLETVKKLNEETIKGSAGDVEKLELYRNVLIDTTNTQEQRTQALNAYNQIADKANQIDKSQLDNLDLINSRISTQISLIEKRAMSRAAEAILSEKAEALLLAQENARTDAIKQQANEQTGLVNENIKQNEYVEGLQKQQRLNQIISSDERVKLAKKEFEESKRTLYSLIDLYGFTASENTKTDEKAKNNERKSALELFKFRTQLLIDEQKQRAELAASGSDSRGYTAEREKQAELEKELVRGIAAFELKEANLSASGRKLIEEKLREDLKKIDRQRRNDIINTQDEMFKAILDSSEKGAKDLEDREKTENERQKQLEISNLATTFEARQRVIEQTGNAELQQILELYQEGKINKEAYELAKLGIENKARRESLKAEIEHYNQLILLSNLTPQEQAKAFEDLQKVRKNLRDLGLKDAEQNANKEIEIERNKNEYLKQLATELYGLVGDVFTAGLERQKNVIQEQIDLLEDRKQKEIEVAEQTIANEVEKAAAISVIEARAQTQREQLERRQRDLEVRRAQIEQISQVGATIGSTAQDVAKLSGQAAIAKAQAAILASNPLTAAFAPAAIAAAGLIASQIPIVIAIGAAQAARILATPVPKYKHGKNINDNYEGLAVVGDGGKKELHVKPDGTATLTPDTPTYTWVGKDDIIYPDASAMMRRSIYQTHNSLKNYDGINDGLQVAVLNEQLIEMKLQNSTLKTGLKSLETAIKNKTDREAYPLNPMQRIEIFKQNNKEYFKRRGYDID